MGQKTFQPGYMLRSKLLTIKPKLSRLIYPGNIQTVLPTKLIPKKKFNNNVLSKKKNQEKQRRLFYNLTGQEARLHLSGK